ncbi:DUF2922 domain-containing protein [Aerococcaceae bacterium zg-ZUI334]|uniref:DUF2922 domain-containing protein n=1 Tax=Aerococcaceae TaxID=186827 RepID=UPI0013BB0DDF|nr:MULTISPECIES: DUF2922 domain-containing protein [unclassified Facklamia]MBR7928323.1 DUF2922 domain-containing protein [Aerococcaceae bacterium zg-ZUI334]NEW65380.1 DUF2922 family protein [Facklamia sp. 252]NEW68532.1 DUF2922 family protein [Facklamia sp. 253]QQD64905.1 DUF2922 domain-containing protein [Aerococcaceae bacterium zg-252]
MSEVVTEKFEMSFKNQAGKSKKVSINNPRTGIDRQTAENAVKKFVDSPIFVDESGDAYEKAVNAQYVRRTVNEVYRNEE